MTNPRVCVLTSSFPEGPGDSAGVFVQEQVKRLALRTSLHVVYPSRTNGTVSEEDFVRHRVGYPFKTYAMSQVRGLECAKALQVVNAMARTVRASGPYDLYHAYWAIPSGFVARWVRGTKPVVLTLCGSDVNAFADKPGFSIAVRWALAGATRVIAVSNGLLDRAIDLGVDPERCASIPSGVDTAAFVPCSHRECARKRLGVPDDFACVFVGSLFRNKRVDRLIRALARVSNRQACALVVVGDGPERRSLEAVAVECGVRVVFLGRLPNEKVAEVVASCDAFVMASKFEGLPTAAQEALSCGVPIVALDVGGLREIVVDGQTGYLARDEIEVTRRLEDIIGDREGLARMRRTAREFAERELSIERTTARTLKVYDSALEAYKGDLPRWQCSQAQYWRYSH